MKSLILTISVVFSVIMTNAQSISPEVIASAGEHFLGTDMQISWTMGEVVIETYEAGNSILTQGFHQTHLIVTPDPVNVPNLADWNVSVYPNPTSEQLIINLTGNNQELLAELYDMNGKLVINEPIYKDQQQKELDLSTLAQSYYLLKVHSKDHRILSTFKIQKTTK